MEPQGVLVARVIAGVPSVCVRWSGLPFENSSWEPISQMRRQFLESHLGDKVVVNGEGNDTILPSLRSQRKKINDRLAKPKEKEGGNHLGILRTRPQLFNRHGREPGLRPYLWLSRISGWMIS